MVFDVFFKALGAVLPRRNSHTSLPSTPTASTKDIRAKTFASPSSMSSASIMATTRSEAQSELIDSEAANEVPCVLAPASHAPIDVPSRAAPVCRFCLEDVCETSEDKDDDLRVVSPCACRGSAALVHMGCLRRWQASLLGHRLHRETVARAASCPVCKETLVVDGLPLKPKIPDVVANGVCVGTLLVATENLEGEGRTFHHSVILICSVNQSGRVWGVDLARTVDSSDIVHRASVDAMGMRKIKGGSSLDVNVRIGGPVCGGRLGLVNYVALSSMLETTRTEVLIQPPGPTLYGPAIWEGAGMDARTTIDLVRSTLNRVQSARGSVRRELLMLFRGHAAWGRGQLESEIHRGNWATCVAKSEDIFATPVPELWSGLRSSGRLTSHSNS